MKNPRCGSWGVFTDASNYTGVARRTQVAESTADILRSRQLIPIEGNKVTSTDTTGINCSPYPKYDADALYERLPDLVNDQFRKWYIKQFYRLGSDRVFQMAAVARADARTDSRRYFSTMLKRAK